MRFQSLHFSVIHGLIYANNQKAACTTVKYSLWQDHDRRMGMNSFRGKTHDRQRSPFLIGAEAIKAAGADELANAQLFSVVRNPYSRILSAYLHHIADDSRWVRTMRRLGLWRSQKLRDDFMLAAGLQRDQSLSFQSFLSVLSGMSSVGLAGHFRPQVDNLYFDQLPYDYIGRVEEKEALAHWLMGFGVELKSRTPHAQGARDLMDDFYTPVTARLVSDHFARDFSAFGYDSGNFKTENIIPIKYDIDRVKLFNLL